jgi:hypothetical protein
MAPSLLQSADLLWNRRLRHTHEPRFGHTQKRFQASDDIHEHAASAYRPEQSLISGYKSFSHGTSEMLTGLSS